MLALSRLKEVLDYDPETGKFYWKVKTANRTVIGAEAGCRASIGYIRICIDGKFYYAHSLALYYVNGVYPPSCVDHINHVRDDNRVVNLRYATYKQNGGNRTPTSILGVSGVSWMKDRNKWYVEIGHNDKQHYIGTFSCLGQAVKARKAAEKKYYGEYAYKG